MVASPPRSTPVQASYRPMTLQLGRLRQISQGARDLDRAIAFYRDVLGLPFLARFGNLAFFDLDGVRLFIEQGDDDESGSILYLAVPDIRAARTELEARGLVFED